MLLYEPTSNDTMMLREDAGGRYQETENRQVIDPGEGEMTKFTINIDVYLDTICPWCYLGKKALNQAIAIYTAQHPDTTFNLIWKPYMLYPNAAISGKYTSTTNGVNV